ncbi:hypothetical protein BKA69DRAFT_68326 [Paraphysoderma sedebokerense]|nr:hypothetical protein BKA69DRAFT_68326 [Paraphysoderma sedebokerense]
MKFSLLTWLLGLLVTVVSANSPPIAGSDTFNFYEDSADTFTFCLKNGVCSDSDNLPSQLSVIIYALPVGFGVFQHLHGATPTNITQSLLPYTLSPDSKQIKHIPPPNWVTNQTFQLSYGLYDGQAYSADTPTINFNFVSANDPPIASNKKMEIQVNTTEVIPLDCYDEESSIAVLNITNAPLSYTGALYQFLSGGGVGAKIFSRDKVTDPSARVWFEPATNYTGPVNFTYSCKDTQNAISNEATVWLNISSPAPPPLTLTTTTTLTVATTVTAPTTTTVLTTVTASPIISATTMFSGTIMFSGTTYV